MAGPRLSAGTVSEGAVEQGAKFATPLPAVPPLPALAAPPFVAPPVPLPAAPPSLTALPPAPATAEVPPVAVPAVALPAVAEVPALLLPPVPVLLPPAAGLPLLPEFCPPPSSSAKEQPAAALMAKRLKATAPTPLYFDANMALRTAPNKRSKGAESFTALVRAGLSR